MVQITAYLPDEVLSELQVQIGTLQATTDSRYVDEVFIRETHAMSNMPGYNRVVFVFPINGERLIQDILQDIDYFSTIEEEEDVM